MTTLKQASSLGDICYGNNNFFEVMKDVDGTIAFMSHEEPCDENDDGTWSGEADSIEKFINDIRDRSDFTNIMAEVMHIISR
jgi:hypothetical protein